MDLQKLENPSFLIVDLETTGLNSSKDKIKYFGGYDINKNEYILRLWDNDIKKYVDKLLKDYTFIITFNGENFDLPFLQNAGVDLTYIRHIDLYQVFKKRKSVIFKSEPYSLSLKNLIKILGLDTDGNKGDLDYNILKKDILSEEDIQNINIYLKQDLLLEYKLWNFLLEKFEPFKEFVSKEKQLRFKYINSTLGSYAYSVICNFLKIDEEYNEEQEQESYVGAYVLKPTKETIVGNILYFDFASLYPNLYVHSNLFSSNCQCCKQEEKWHGNTLFKLNGYYCSKKQGQVEELIKSMFLKRKELKKIGDFKEKVYKIVLNSMYGISSQSKFKHLYRENLASDCTSLAQQCLKYAINRFIDSGFIVLYGDTDSIMVEIPKDKSEDDALVLAQLISVEISSNFPFPWEEFNLKVEDKIKYLQFFKDDSGKLLKKHYLYVNEKNELIIKGLDIIQKDCSQASKIIFEKVIKPKILNNLICKFNKKEIDYCIKEILNQDIALFAKTFSIRDTNDYKSETSIYSSIKERYGSGEIKLIKNYLFGVGESVKYCSIEEAKKLKIEQINLEDVYSELSPFILKESNKTLFDF